MQGPSPVAQDASPDPPDRRRLVEEAITRWKGQLVDLSARNNLLYFRDLAKGTLELGDAEDTVGTLLGGGGVRVSTVAGTGVDHVGRVRVIRGKAREALEERGLDVLFVAYGMATWREPEAERAQPPCAPLILLPVRLDPAGPVSDPTDHTLRIAGDAHVNPTLMRKLLVDFGVPVDADALDADLAGASGVEDLDRAVDALRVQCDTVEGFDVTPRLVLATFSYAKLPMVADLDRAGEALVGDDLIAALVGDLDARERLRERNRADRPDPGLPDHVAPADEYLVLDADATQGHALNDVLAGHDLIVQGPPGTGKSQTIANLIAALAAEGRSVLFVAEKRAAIDAVLRRLHAVGLGDLVLDMHEAAQAKRHELAQELWRTVDEPLPPEEDLGDVHRALVAARAELAARTEAQHAVRAPWGVTVFHARVRRAELGASAPTTLRLTGEALAALDADTYPEAAEALARWFQVGAAAGGAWAGAWSDVHVDAPDDLEAARGAVDRAQAALPRARALAEAVSVDVRLPVGPTPRDWERLADLALRANTVAATFHPGLFEEDLSALCDGMQRAMAGGLRRLARRLGGGDAGAARDAVDGMRVDDADLDDVELHRRLCEARDLAGEWRRASTPFAYPLPSRVAEDAREAVAALVAALEPLEAWFPGVLGPSRDADEMETTLRALARDAGGLRAVMEARRAEALLQGLHLGPLLDEIRGERLARHTGVARLEWLWLTSILEEVGLADRHVGVAAGADPEVARFCEADRRHIASGAGRVRRAVADHLVRAREEHVAEAVLLQRQATLAAKSRKHLPVRGLFEEAPHVLRALRPCWAMSPLVVSQVLPAVPDLFDVVVFDEASQVPPAEAVPAILRGRRLVVAGDRRQLPPTMFFAAALAEGEEDLTAPDAGTEGYESVLDALAGLVPERMLRWHYRSHDERLIAFSNAHVYDGALTTFPGVGGDPCVRHALVDGAGDDGGDDTSAAEVARVAELVLEHARLHPAESLGVIAMGVRHAERLEEGIRRALEDAPPDVSAVLAEDRPEPFFVKNLERVQGDERDAIILSIGYGRSARTGKLAYRFGPLLQEGGERRLNVAVTRARRRLTLVSSFTHEDMDPDRPMSDGVRLLREYLAYAAKGGTVPESHGGRAVDDPLARQIGDALERAGVPVEIGVGASEHRIDIVAGHPDRPDRYVLAIEHDGPGYHRSPTTRARDRLRREQLERVGWAYHRVWASEWYADPEGALERLIAAWNGAVARLGPEDVRVGGVGVVAESRPGRAG